jgi:hypothetical protein
MEKYGSKVDAKDLEHLIAVCLKCYKVVQETSIKARWLMLAIDIIELGSHRFSKQAFGKVERDTLVNLIDHYISDNNQDEAANVLELLKAVALN